MSKFALEDSGSDLLQVDVPTPLRDHQNRHMAGGDSWRERERVSLSGAGEPGILMIRRLLMSR
jgi:hypothetical protein